MSDDFGTVSVRRGDRAREIEVLRQHYREHREALHRMAAEAPSDHLAGEYARLVRDIDASLMKLEEIERRAPSAGGAAIGTAAAAASAAASRPAGATRMPAPPDLERPHGDPLREQTEPGTRPLITPPVIHDDAAIHEDTYEPPVATASSRMPLIVIAALVVVAILGYLIWRASSDRRRTATPVVETAAPVTPAADTAAPAPASTTTQPARGIAAAPAGLSVTPALADYGNIRKGTRAARQFEITNNTANPVQIQVARSQCRCLFYEYTDKIAPGKKDTITVAIDAARVKGGSVAETVAVTAKGNASLSTSFQVQADVK